MKKLKEVKVLMTGTNNDIPRGVEQPTIKELTNKINEIVEWINDHSEPITTQPEKEWKERFDKEFGEDFFDLHYRFCPMIGEPDWEERQKACSEQKEEVQKRIKQFISSLLSQKDKDVTQLGLLFGVKLFIETKDEKIVKACKKFLEELTEYKPSDLEKEIEALLKPTK